MESIRAQPHTKLKRPDMTRFYWSATILVIALATGVTIWMYGDFPARIPTHWNIRGEIDGYGSRATLFVFPVLMVVMLPLFYFLPALSPKDFQVDSARSTYLYIMLLTIGLFAYMHFVLLYTVHQAVAKEPAVDLGRAFFAGLFIFFGLMGNVIGNVHKNFFIGVRVPWTLASDRVWNDTHRMAGWLWMAVGATGVALIVTGAPLLVSIVLLVLAGLIPVVYAFVHYKSLERRGAL